MFLTFSQSACGNPERNAGEFGVGIGGSAGMIRVPCSIREPGRHLPLLPTDPAAIMRCDGE